MDEPALNVTRQRARQQAIAEAVLRRGSIAVEDLARSFGVSLMTIYRDVAALEAAGMVQRQRGQVLALASSLNEASAGFRLTQNAEVKAAMAQVLAERVPPGSSVMLDDSTSGVWLLRALEDTSRLTVVTNSLLVAQEIERRDDVRLVMVGGEYQPWAQALMGPATSEMLRSMHVDLCVMSASGLDGERCLHPYPDVADVKRAMLQAATTKVLMLDHSKLARRALHMFARLPEFDIIVVDRATPEDFRAGLAARGVEVLVAAR